MLYMTINGTRHELEAGISEGRALAVALTEIRKTGGVARVGYDRERKNYSDDGTHTYMCEVHGSPLIVSRTIPMMED